MATEVEILTRLDTMRSLPQRLEGLASCLGTVNWPGQPTRLNFPSGMELSAEERLDVEALLHERQMIATGGNLTKAECEKGRLSLLTKLLMGSASAATSDEAADARLEMYEMAVEDMAPWVIAAARKRWAQRRVPATVRNPNYSFAPAPADLRAICEDELAQINMQIAKLKRLLIAVPVARAMDPAPIEEPKLSIAGPGGRVVSLALKRA